MPNLYLRKKLNKLQKEIVINYKCGIMNLEYGNIMIPYTRTTFSSIRQQLTSFFLEITRQDKLVYISCILF
jgi:hypothetical protein